ncbi:hypothetical protein C5167_010776 [Papaver somniferum]|uniref:F-box domain-containing protein n=1 Tax=Papaver somniferum TaxID=3469 RepID=A0A4Y7K587_PAPSO|nr:hypothetical protein C5167_010776 [Papaver somniferum]
MEEPRDSPICNSIDRISNLPENLIHHILSFMDMIHVVYTCVLSKRWKNLWAITPILNLFSLAISNNNQNSGVPFQKFIKFVDQVFILRDNSNIQSVNFVCGKQRNFVIDISLELKLGDNSSTIVLPSSMDLSRLTFMKLDSLPSDVNLTNRLFLKCPVLESLIIEGRLGHMDLQISSLTLEHLTIIDLVSKTSSKVKIDAPNLWAKGFLAAFGKNSLQFSNLRLVKLESYLPKHIIRALGWLRCISPNVESLSIVNLGMPSSDIPDSEDYFAGVPLDHLRSVEIRGLLGHFNELKLVEIIFKKAVVLEKMLLFSCKKSTTEKCLLTFGEKLLTLPRASSNITTFFI